MNRITKNLVFTFSIISAASMNADLAQSKEMVRTIKKQLNTFDTLSQQEIQKIDNDLKLLDQSTESKSNMRNNVSRLQEKFSALQAKKTVQPAPAREETIPKEEPLKNSTASSSPTVTQSALEAAKQLNAAQDALKTEQLPTPDQITNIVHILEDLQGKVARKEITDANTIKAITDTEKILEEVREKVANQIIANISPVTQELATIMEAKKEPTIHDFQEGLLEAQTLVDQAEQVAQGSLDRMKLNLKALVILREMEKYKNSTEFKKDAMVEVGIEQLKERIKDLSPESDLDKPEQLTKGKEDLMAAIRAAQGKTNKPSGTEAQKPSISQQPRLLEQIRAGAKLKPVEKPTESKPATSGRGALLSDIAKASQERETRKKAGKPATITQPAKPAEEKPASMMDALRAKLAADRKVKEAEEPEESESSDWE